MQRRSDKVGPRLDEQLKHETEGLRRGGHGTHAEEWKGSEPRGEDQPELSLIPGGDQSAEGRDLSMADTEARSVLASYIGRPSYPIDRDDLVELAAGRHAPDVVVDAIARLPEGSRFDNLQEVWKALGGPTERARSRR